MTHPRLAGHEFRLLPENHGETLEWRHTTLVLRRPHRRVERMRAYLNRVVLGPPPLYAASRRLGHPPYDEATARSFIDAYRDALRRRRLTNGTIHVTLHDDDPVRGQVLTVERRPEETP